jgi:4-hydroxy-tetrahydrodipicolinate synthase
MRSIELITAIGTPLEADESLHVEGLQRHLADQSSAGIDRILVAGSMGAMQMLPDGTYRALVERASRLWNANGELLVGVGDTGWARTRDRIDLVSRFKIDGVVVLTPFLYRFTQQQLVDYYIALADYSPLPIYLYDLPTLTRAEIGLETYDAVIRHPNIRGAKVSGRLDVARELIRRYGDEFRVIVAEPDKVDTLLREGVTSHLDGMFAMAPHWIVAIARAAKGGDYVDAAEYQGKLNALRDLLIGASSVMGAFTAIMNARGISGKFHGFPISPLDDDERIRFLSAPIVRELVSLELTTT